MRYAYGIAFFNSLGLVSGGLREQAASLFVRNRRSSTFHDSTVPPRLGR